jgi:phosphohistidine phosphatase SixA
MKTSIISLIFFALLLGCKSSDIENPILSTRYFVKYESKTFNFSLPKSVVSYRALFNPNKPLIQGNQLEINKIGVYSVMARTSEKDSILVKIFASVEPEKFEKLSDGSTYALLVRHSDADVGVDDFNSTLPEWWTSCDATKARQINKAGLKYAKSIGENIKSWNIPVGSLLSSEFCRCRQTLESMNLGSFQTSKELTYRVYKTNHVTEVTSLLKKLPINNKVHILIGHSELINLQPSLRFEFDWNDALIYRLENGKEPQFIAKINYPEWIDYNN